mmetsp:Transcript_5867/g.12809  ORF Transcript_5867/g.12809 Transcript_5867/m.12809 type:complete len:228 (+) Transcript_5867:1679-2362(+)
MVPPDFLAKTIPVQEESLYFVASVGRVSTMSITILIRSTKAVVMGETHLPTFKLASSSHRPLLILRLVSKVLQQVGGRIHPILLVNLLRSRRSNLSFLHLQRLRPSQLLPQRHLRLWRIIHPLKIRCLPRVCAPALWRLFTIFASSNGVAGPVTLPPRAALTAKLAVEPTHYHPHLPVLLPEQVTTLIGWRQCLLTSSPLFVGLIPGGRLGLLSCDVDGSVPLPPSL